MLLLSWRGKWMEREEWRKISRQREGNVPASVPLGSPSPSLPTGEKWKLLPGREAMTSPASAPCRVRGALPPSPIFREQSPAGASSLHAQSPDPLALSRGKRCSPAIPVIRLCQKTLASSPNPGPAAHPLPPPPHTSNPAVGQSLARFPPQRRSSVAAAAAAAAAATESSIPAGATWNSRASRGAPGSPGLQPLRRTARLTPAPSRTESPRNCPPPYKTRPEPPLSAQHPLPRLPPPPPSSLPPPPHLSH